MSSVFDPKNQELDINSKIVVSLERISQAFKIILWNQNKKYGLSPIQLQILTFLLFHDEEFRTISNLAHEFNTTKASISDSVKVLEHKKFVSKEKSKKDFRISTISLTEKSVGIATEISNFAESIEQIVSEVSIEKKEVLLDALLEIIHKLFLKGTISIQRMCLTCNHYIKAENSENYICSLMATTLKSSELRVDCNQYK